MPGTSRLAPAFGLLLAALVLAAPGAVAAPSSADASSDWAEFDEATITPGVQMVTDGSQCTANFVFTDGTDVYLGYAAHCAGTGGSTATNGCEADTLPRGTDVQIEGASRAGTLAYSSWETMQARGERDTNTCRYNDFALVSIHPDDHSSVNPTIPFWGGPDALGDSTAATEQVYTYGNSSLRLGIDLLKPKEGYSLGQTADGWNHPVYTVTPGIPGDSGSAFLDSAGGAVGTLSTLAVAPLAGSNGVSDLALALDYATTHGGVSAQLANGTEPFAGGFLLP